MSTAELSARIGTIATLHYSTDGLRYRVKVLDARTAFGRIDYQVEPLDGSGTAWVSGDRLVF